MIGLGDRSAHMVRVMHKADPAVRVTAVADLRGRATVRRFDGSDVCDPSRVRVVAEADELLDPATAADEFDGFVIATNCDSHATLAARVARTGLPLFLEKPIAISWEQLRAVHRAYAQRDEGPNVVVSFPLRLTVHVQTALEIVRSGRLGTINQVQAVNNVPYGGVYYGQWYRDYPTTGGLWLQKATHDFDYINAILGRRPFTITAMSTRACYGGTMPQDLTCSKCSITETCPESPANLARRGDDGGTMNFHSGRKENADHLCTFSKSILHQDAGSAIVMYDGGAHASYSQNFVTRRSAGLRGATVIGYDGTLQFDWQSETLRVIDHHRDRVDEIAVKASGAHGGGDYELAKNFIDVVRGRAPSRSTLHDGMLSAAMCLAARDSAYKRTMETIPDVTDATLEPRAPSMALPTIEPPFDK